MAKSVSTHPEPTRDEIAARAHGIYEREGRPHGKDQEHWLKAEAELIAERKAQMAAKAAPEKTKPGWSAPRRQNLNRNNVAPAGK